jgi:hypothetical protein
MVEHEARCEPGIDGRGFRRIGAHAHRTFEVVVSSMVDFRGSYAGAPLKRARRALAAGAAAHICAAEIPRSSSGYVERARGLVPALAKPVLAIDEHSGGSEVRGGSLKTARLSGSSA